MASLMHILYVSSIVLIYPKEKQSKIQSFQDKWKSRTSTELLMKWNAEINGLDGEKMQRNFTARFTFWPKH